MKCVQAHLNDAPDIDYVRWAVIHLSMHLMLQQLQNIGADLQTTHMGLLHHHAVILTNAFIGG